MNDLVLSPTRSRSRSVNPPDVEPQHRSRLHQYLVDARERVASRITIIRSYAVRRFTIAVDKLGPSLERSPLPELLEAMANLRPVLRREGTTSDAGIRAMAIVREVARRQLQMFPHLQQISAARGLFGGYAIEMATGEGKTLTAGLGACMLALAGRAVHVVSTNDYLAERDAESMAPLFAAFDLNVLAIKEGMTPDERRAVYSASIVYVSAKELTFDFLKDRMATARATRLRRRLLALADPSAQPSLVMRGLDACIVDEADSVFVDEARTPLVLARREDQLLWTKQALTEALTFARRLEEGKDYRIDRKGMSINLTDRGLDRLEELTHELDGPWRVTLFREDLGQKALSALHLFKREIHYIVNDGKIELISEHTGRSMADRTLQDGLHQLIEVKEECDPSAVDVVMGKTSYQRFFRRYHHLCGMSGTLREVAGEIAVVYGLRTVRIKPRLPLRRRRFPSHVYPSNAQKWDSIARRVAELQSRGRAVLVGTRSIEGTNAISERLAVLGITHEVLNAKNPSQEAEIVAAAGQVGHVTVATSMAGRGTDIKPADEVLAAGGLHVLICEHHDSSRVDRQFVGRTGRQGNPGSYEYFVSLDDPVMEAYGSLTLPLARTLARGTQIGGMAVLTWAQRRIEAGHGRIRRELSKFDEETDKALSFAGEGE